MAGRPFDFPKRDQSVHFPRFTPIRYRISPLEGFNNLPFQSHPNRSKDNASSDYCIYACNITRLHRRIFAPWSSRVCSFDDCSVARSARPSRVPAALLLNVEIVSYEGGIRLLIGLKDQLLDFYELWILVGDYWSAADEGSLGSWSIAEVL